MRCFSIRFSNIKSPNTATPLKVAVFVNDMSEVNVDAQLMINGSASLSRVDERLVEMQNE